MIVLVTGASGQLGQSLQQIAENFPEFEFVFKDSQALDVTNIAQSTVIFEQVRPDYCINTAAYTAVDRAEVEVEKAQAVNVSGPENLARLCKDFGSILIHISTDFIFDGVKNSPYTESDKPNPKSIYGQTKLDGENAILRHNVAYFIIRTSWVYSKFGNNFMKTMIRIGKERDLVSVVSDQIGTPTNAVDLAEILVKVIAFCEEKRHLGKSLQPFFGIYNFSNEGQCSWYDFAKAIYRTNGISTTLKPIPTAAYPTPAVRPKYSVLDKSKIKKTFGLSIRPWDDDFLKE